jgi:hypothetical protein
MKRLSAFAGTAALSIIFMALFVPTTYVEIKTALLFFCLVTTIILVINGSLNWSRETVYACLLVATVGLANSLHGEINGNPGAIRVLSVMFLWPLLYAFISALASNPSALYCLNKIFLASLLMVVFYSFIYLGNAAGLIPDWAYVELDQGQGVGFYEGYIQYNLYSISSLLFLVPFAMHYAWLLYGKGRLTFKLLLLIGSAAILVFLTGRRAMLLVFILFPIIVFTSNLFLGVNTKKFTQSSIKFSPKYVFMCTSVFIAVGYLIIQMDIQMDAVWGMFVGGFDFQHGYESGALARTEQFHALVQSWLNSNLLLGVGNGGVTDVVRSPDMPWAYELTCVYLLFSTGIFGVIFYVTWFGWGLLRLRKGLNAKPESAIYVVPMLTGVFGLAIGAASNPYFGKFDYLWIIMLPHLISGGLEYQNVSK